MKFSPKSLIKIDNNVLKEEYSIPNFSSNNVYNETDIPQIFTYYFNPKPSVDDDIIIPIYITDAKQVEYRLKDYSHKFNLRIDIDGDISFQNNLSAGDINVNLGKLSAGNHYFSLQLIDSNGRESQRLFHEIWVIDYSIYTITENQTYNITLQDLIDNNITIGENLELTDEQMLLNKIGLNTLLNNIKTNGYRKCIMPENSFILVNDSPRDKDATEENPYIKIPSGLTFDMNGSTIKLKYAGAGTNNLNLTMCIGPECVDTHVINGKLIGDWKERFNAGYGGAGLGESWDGETSNCIRITGKYNSIENMEISYVSGYNTITSAIPCYYTSGSWIDNINIINGQEVESDSYMSSEYLSLDNFISYGYIGLNLYLGAGGLVGKYWDIDFSFYDTNKTFLEKIKIYQHRLCKIPNDAKYVRASVRAKTIEIPHNFYFHTGYAPSYLEVKNCNYHDNRACSAPSVFKHFMFKDCTWSRCGHSITPCPIDLEDGWEHMQDFFLINCDVLEKEPNATTGIIMCAGLNHVIDNCNNFDLGVRHRVNGLLVSNVNNCSISYEYGNASKYSSKFSKCIGIEKINFKADDDCDAFNIISFSGNPSRIDIIGKTFIIDSDVIIGKADSLTYQFGNNLRFKNCNINITKPYYLYNIIVVNSIYNLDNTNVDNAIKLSFNKQDAIHTFIDTVFNGNTEFVKHDSFNNGNFINCKINGTSLIQTTDVNNINDIKFKQCIFNDTVTIDLGTKSHIVFEQCIFKYQPIFLNSGENNSIFSKCKFLE